MQSTLTPAQLAARLDAMRRLLLDGPAPTRDLSPIDQALLLACFNEGWTGMRGVVAIVDGASTLTTDAFVLQPAGRAMLDAARADLH